MKIRLIILGLLSSVLSMAQTENKDVKCYEGKSPLPAFVYDNSDVIFGVSDPAMDNDVARKLAITRAVFLYALQKNAGLKMLTDFYSSNTTLTNTYDCTREKCMTLANINISPVTYRYNIIDEFVSDRGETFVCLKISETADSSMTIAANCDFMSSDNYDTFERCEYKVLMTVSSQNENLCDTMDYSFKGTLNDPVMSSRFESHDKLYNRQSYWYGDEGSVNEGNNKYDLKNALWCSIVGSLCNNIVSMVYDDSVIKNMNETYKEVNQNMSREIVNCRISCRAVLKGIKDNKIAIDWNIRKL